jgi:hypothetical protein
MIEELNAAAVVFNQQSRINNHQIAFLCLCVSVVKFS